MDKYTLTQPRHGLTTIELIIAIVLGGIVVLSILPFIIHFANTQYRQIIYAKQVSDIYQASGIIKDDLRRAVAYLRSPTASDTKTPAPSSGWHFKGDSSEKRNLILLLPATTKSPKDKNRESIQTAISQKSCDNDLKDTLFYTAVYYIKDSTLYRRTIIQTPTGKILCGGVSPYQKNTQLIGGSSRDMTVLQHVDKFSVDYHSSESVETDGTIYNATSISNATKNTPIELTHATIKIRTKQMIENKDSIYEIRMRHSL